MKGLCVLVCVLLFVCGSVSSDSTPKLPNYSPQYLVNADFLIPYFNISEPIRMVFDQTNNRQVWNYYNGMDLFYYFFNEPTSYQVNPVIGTETCFASPSTGFAPLQSIFPTFDSTWSFTGTAMVNGISCNQFEMQTVNYNKTGVYIFSADAKTGDPVQFYMNGVNIIFNSHPDIYIINYSQYVPNYVNQSEWIVPSLCNNITSSSTQETLSEIHIARQVKALFDSLREVVSSHETLFQEFIQKFQRRYETQEERAFRKGVFLKNHNYINSWNLDSSNTFKLKMNHYGDMEREEFSKIMLPKVKRPEEGNGASAIHPPPHEPSSLPQQIDWRSYGAVTMVKDQGACGSCWTFGSTGSLEGHWKLKTGNLVSLSEQQIVDCCWINWGSEGESTLGCNGGFAAPAFQWIQDNNGIATESDYAYLAQDGECRSGDRTSGVQVTGYVNVTAGSENALMSAVALGPVAIAIDASLDSFRFYGSGVYYDSKCRNGVDYLDHEVLAIGYGMMNGVEYWLVKNSWSTHWGDDGYIYMSRDRDNNCGVASQATYPLV